MIDRTYGVTPFPQSCEKGVILVNFSFWPLLLQVTRFEINCNNNLSRTLFDLCYYPNSLYCSQRKHEIVFFSSLCLLKFVLCFFIFDICWAIHVCLLQELFLTITYTYFKIVYMLVVVVFNSYSISGYPLSEFLEMYRKTFFIKIFSETFMAQKAFKLCFTYTYYFIVMKNWLLIEWCLNIRWPSRQNFLLQTLAYQFDCWVFGPVLWSI